MSCLDENKVVEFIQGLLAPEARVAIEAHLDECPSCRQLMAEVARLSFANSSREALAPTLPPIDMGSGTASVRTPTGSRELLPEQVVAGRFRIVRRIGRGSFGNVYEAEDLQLEERVALKLLRPEVRDNPGLLGHLHHEIVVGRRVSHPHVCRIYDLGTCEDFHFISMALVAGQGLDRYLERGLPPLEKAHTILVQICEALEAAHHQGVVHRDLKPSNIMVHDDPQGALNITVMDFGLARDLRAGPSLSGVLIGSPAYWSPEQARGERATARSDIFSLGLIGCDLFGVKHPAFGAVGGLEPVPPAYRAVLERCLRTTPEQRFCSAREVRDALVIASKHARIRRRRIRAVLVTGLAAVAGAASVLLLTLLHAPERPPPVRPDRGALAATGVPRRDAASPPRVAGKPEEPRPDAASRRPAPAMDRPVRPPAGRKAGKPALLGAMARPDSGPESPASADAGPPGQAQSPAAILAPLRERLDRLETERRGRGILIDDVPGGRARREELRAALGSGKLAAAQSALGRLEQSLRQVKIDQGFVSRKLERLNRVKRSVKLPEATEKKVSSIFAGVHERFFSGDYQGANAQLNGIWRLLGRED